MKLPTLVKIIILSLLVVIAYPQRYEIIAKVRWGINYYLPCTLPITYSIGTFDIRFGVSREEFLRDIARAEKVWEDAAGKDLFRHVEQDGTLTMNLIYDSRQETTEKLQKIDKVITGKQSTYEELKWEYNALKEKLASERAQYDTAVAKLTQMKRAFEKKVDYWNRNWGAPKGEYETLQQEQEKINTAVVAVNAKLTELNTTIKNINAAASQTNALIDELHLDVEKYNTTRGTNGEEFSEGEYTRDGPDEYINIYEFSSDAKLFRVLTHELGHALGLQHVDDENAIMYRLNSSESETLTTTDKAEIMRVCRLEK